MKQPVGFIDPDHPHRVWRLLRSVYGLRQAGQLWNGTAHTHLMELGFTQSKLDQCIYFRVTEVEGPLIVGLYVNNYLPTGGESARARFRGKRKERFNIKKIGEAKFVVGIQVTHTPDGIHLTQSFYILRILEEFGMTNCHPNVVPMAGEDVKAIFATVIDENTPRCDPTLY